jgi:dienelactone hydrolase family protein
MTDAVPGFDVTTFSHGGRTHEVFLAGAGPAVIVVHEMPGLTPGMIAFGQRLIDAGYRAYLPSLFGRPVRRSAAVRWAGRCGTCACRGTRTASARARTRCSPRNWWTRPVTRPGPRWTG